MRGDMGISLRYKRPVSEVIGRRMINSLVLAALAFCISIPIAVVLGLIAGLNEGKNLDRILTLGGHDYRGSPDFATGTLTDHDLRSVAGMWCRGRRFS